MNRSAYFDRVSALGCMVCGAWPQIHHIGGGSAADAGIRRGLSQKVSDEHVVPLCSYHHVGDQGIHKIGVRTWERLYGSQMDMWLAVQVRLEGVSPDKPVKRRKPIAKILPRVA